MRKEYFWFALIAVLGVTYFVLNNRSSVSPVEQPVAAEAPVATPDAPSTTTTPAVAPVATPVAPTPMATSAKDKIQTTLNNALPILRQKAAIAASKSEDIVHSTPKQTIQAAQQLGDIVEMQEQHPEQAETFLKFYRNCAEDEEVVTVIRSQCLDYYVKLAKMNPSEQQQFLATFPPEVLNLYQALQ